MTNEQLDTELARLRKLNAELAASLKEMADIYQDDPRDCRPQFQPTCIKRARAAIRKAKAEQS